jgi:hypothetical protein
MSIFKKAIEATEAGLDIIINKAKTYEPPGDNAYSQKGLTEIDLTGGLQNNGFRER